MVGRDSDGPAAMLDALAYLQAARTVGTSAALEVCAMDDHSVGAVRRGLRSAPAIRSTCTSPPSTTPTLPRDVFVGDVRPGDDRARDGAVASLHEVPGQPVQPQGVSQRASIV